MALLAAVTDPLRVQDRAPDSGSCAAAIRAALADIASRDLDTSEGPPLNAFLTLNPNALAQAEALDRKAAAGEPKGPLFCVPVAVKDNFDTYDMPTTVEFRAEPRVEVVERDVFHDVGASLAQDVDRPCEQLLRIGVGRVCKSSKRNARACRD